MNTPLVIPLAQIDSSQLLFDIEGINNIIGPFPQIPSHDLRMVKPVSMPHYKAAYDYCLQQLNLGNSYLINLTFPTKIETNLSLQQIFYLSKSKYRLWMRNNFVCFSPETFVKIRNGIISSCPMKGTIDAAMPYAENLILNDTKETAEHNTIVDLIRNDLSMVAIQVRVEKFRYIDKIATNNKDLLQVSSLISGHLPADYASHIGDILFNLLPAGSVSGAPKKKTLEIIQHAEQSPRGYYTGVFGYFDGCNMNTAVMIRFIEQSNGKMYYKSGGGITTQSMLHKEYEELLNKVYFSV